MIPDNWTLLEDAEAVALEARDRILAAASEAIHDRGCFRMVVAGGSTPERSYNLLAEAESDWGRWELYFGDERCLPAEHPERNSVLLERTLSHRVPIPPHQIHPIAAELGAEQAAAHYQEIVADALPFDLVLLGMGEDGHTASLFPDQSAPDGQLVCAVHNAPKPPPERVTLTQKALVSSRKILFLITGETKRSAVNAWLNGSSLPASQIAGKGKHEVLIDQAANPRA
ncbi:MAG: 6-phosphogluconolactonase [Gammaproteobacteria bacterium]|nr:6-phosphogluconolactonase [Gammaproteobacteria bacterium]